MSFGPFNLNNLNPGQVEIVSNKELKSYENYIRKFKSKKLELPDNKTTRPLRDFVKENIFNLITHSKDIKFNFKESKVCDLFSGSGSFGLECLSRGSENVIFVEQNINVIKILKRNILKMKATTNYDVIENDVISFLSSKTIRSNLDLIFIDPPYLFKKNKEIFNLISKKFQKYINNISYSY